MKKIFISIIAIAILVSCESQDNSALSKLKQERDSLGVVQKKVTLRIMELEDEITKLDSTKKLHTVTALKLEPQTFEHYFRVYGNVESNKSISLYAETSGKIDNILVKRGQNVAKGQLLAVLDGAVIQQNISEMETSLELAEKIYQKQSKLWLEDKIGSEVQYLEAKNSKESLEKRLETLKAQLAMTRVRAPFNGVIDEIFPKNGEMASTQMPMFRLVNLTDVYLTASVSEAYVGKVKTGTPAIVDFTSIGEKVESEVFRVGNYINPNNRTFDVNISLDSHKGFKPNMMGSVDLLDYMVENAFVVPSRLVMENTNGDSYVYVFVDSESKTSAVLKVSVKAGMSYEGKTEILEGLKGGELIVDKGSRSVKDGQKVRLVTLD